MIGEKYIRRLLAWCPRESLRRWVRISRSKKFLSLTITIIIIMTVMFRLFYYPQMLPMSVKSVVAVYKPFPSTVKVENIQITFKTVSLAKELWMPAPLRADLTAKEGYNFFNVEFRVKNIGETETIVDLEKEYFFGVKFDSGYLREMHCGSGPLKPEEGWLHASGFEIPENIKPIELIIYSKTTDNPIYILKLRPLWMGWWLFWAIIASTIAVATIITASYICQRRASLILTRPSSTSC